jgi:peptidoglycan hydrolase-like protein with peptidoglycan-binding domain
MKRKTYFIVATFIASTTAIGSGAAFLNSGKTATATQSETAVSTAKVERGSLASVVNVNGILTYSGQSDGSPYSVVNQATGTFTQLPEEGDSIDCGNVLYRVGDHPVVLLCGVVPAYRDLQAGIAGNDVAQLNRYLHAGGYDTDAVIKADDKHFTSKTTKALQKFQRDKGLDATGMLGVDEVVFLNSSVRIIKVTAQLGAPAQPGEVMLQATSSTPEVQVKLDPSQQNDVKQGDKVSVTLPSNRSVTGTVARMGKVAQIPEGKDGNAGPATIPVYILLDDPSSINGLDNAPVRVEITTKGVENVLSVPVTALVGQSGGGYAVEIVKNGSHELVSVKLGLFDSSGGRVEVNGNVREGDDVVVPSV